MSLPFTVLSPSVYQGHSYLVGVRDDDNLSKTLAYTRQLELVILRPQVEDFHPELLTYRNNSSIFCVDFKSEGDTLVADKKTFYSLFEFKDAFKYTLTKQGKGYKDAGIAIVICQEHHLAPQIMLLNPQDDIIKLRLEYRKERDDDFFLKRDKVTQEEFGLQPETL